MKMIFVIFCFYRDYRALSQSVTITTQVIKFIIIMMKKLMRKAGNIYTECMQMK